MARLVSSWNIQNSAMEPHSIIRVSNLQTNLSIATDAWGRYPSCQPALISCAVSLRESFASASTNDAVTNSTVHYGTLSKAIIEACCRLSCIGRTSSTGLGRLLRHIQSWLTGIKILDESDLDSPKNPILESVGLEILSLEILLPKASLFGSGVKIEGSFRYDERNTAIITYSTMLGICDLRIPAIIGVNSNERLAKQIVVASVQIDCHDPKFEEAFCELEQLTVKTVEESSFHTLEALGEHLGQRVITYYLKPQILSLKEVYPLPTVRLKMSKPTAVTFADSPTVEMLVDPGKVTSRGGEKLTSHNLTILPSQRPPYPLQTRLVDWILQNDLESD